MSRRIQLAHVSVKNLFGLFDHSVDLRTEERVTILHGPNGVGKTVLLRLISSFFSGQYQSLLDTNFEELFIGLSDGRSATVTRGQNAFPEAKRAKDVLIIASASETFQWSRDHVHLKKMAMYIDGEVPYITRVADELWTDDRTGEPYSVDQLVRRFSDVVPDKIKDSIPGDPGWLAAFRKAITVHLVETQRLLLPDANYQDHRFRSRAQARKAFTSTVKKYAADLRKRSAAALGEYAEHSQSLDRSFPQRMLAGPKSGVLDTNGLKHRMDQLEQRRIRLRKLGLIEDDTSYPFDISTLDSATSNQRDVMTLYVEDTESKLSVLDDLEQRVDLLLGNINRKFRPNKSLQADKSLGLLVRDNLNLGIDLDSLSSGEQHELVLIYDLLFQVKPNSLVLIDEPELSLHVTWQKAFLEELFAIIRVVDFDVLLATHSPFIVGDRIDLMVSLSLDSTADELKMATMEGQVA